MSSPFREDACGGHCCLLTGGGTGIGLEIARQLLLHGAAAVTIFGRRAAVLEKACETLRSAARAGAHVSYVAGDVRKQEDCVKAVEHCTQTHPRPLSVLVNCAAGNFLALPEDMSANAFRTVMDIDAVGSFSMARAAFPSLRAGAAAAAARGGSVVINVSATLHKPATWYQTHSAAAKAAVDSLTRSLALEWGGQGIRCVGVAPGPIAGTPGFMKLGGALEGAAEAIAETIPLGRVGEKADIGLFCVFAASAAAAFLTGDTVCVDGGAQLWRPAPLPRDAVRDFAKAAEAPSRKMGAEAAAAKAKM